MMRIGAADAWPLVPLRLVVGVGFVVHSLPPLRDRREDILPSSRTNTVAASSVAFDLLR
jgi:hypothetical protein